MSEVCRKDSLARNLNRMRKLFPSEYNFFPQTWILPLDYGEFVWYAKRRKGSAFIVKPDNSSQGRGIWLTRNYKQVSDGDSFLVQKYISKPLLIDGYKFDLRVYVCVTSCDPLRIYVYKEGLARFATISYREPNSSNIGNSFMHLTNYSINKASSGFVRATEENESSKASKRSISSVMSWLEARHYDVTDLWNSIDDVIIKTLISAENVLRQNYRTIFLNHNLGSACFEILGFDILIDRKLRAYLLEVNHSPSFHTDSRLDLEIKEGLIEDTLGIVNFAAANREKCLQEERRNILARKMPSQPQTKQQPPKLPSKAKSSASQNPYSATTSSSASVRIPAPTQSHAHQSSYTYDEVLQRTLEYEDGHLGKYRRIFPVQTPKEPRKQNLSSTSVSAISSTETITAERIDATKIETVLQSAEKLSKNATSAAENRPVNQAKLDIASKTIKQTSRVTSGETLGGKIDKNGCQSTKVTVSSRTSATDKEEQAECNKYDQFFRGSSRSLYRETAAFRARAECARITRAVWLPSKIPSRDASSHLNTSRTGDENSKPKTVKKPSIQKVFKENSLIPGDILNIEESHRSKLLEQRGELVRRCGVERMVYRLLSPNGELGPHAKKFVQETARGYYRLQEDETAGDTLLNVHSNDSKLQTSSSTIGADEYTNEGTSNQVDLSNDLDLDSRPSYRYCNTPVTYYSEDSISRVGAVPSTHKFGTVPYKSLAQRESHVLQNWKALSPIGRPLWSSGKSTGSSCQSASKSPDRSSVHSSQSNRDSERSLGKTLNVVGLSLIRKGKIESGPLSKRS